MCEPLSYDTCREFATSFHHLYEGRDISEYPHPNPMIKIPNTTLDRNATNRDFFDGIQFPLGYNFAQGDSGIVNRTFKDSAFDGVSVHDKTFSLVNPETGKVFCVVSSTFVC